MLTLRFTRAALDFEEIKRSLYAHHSMFYGILVALFYEDNDRHNLPHIHVRYSGMKASVAIGDGRVLAGEEPFRIAPLQ